MLKNNIEYLYRSKETKVILTSSTMVCNIDFRKVAKFHEESGKDITIVYKKVKTDNQSFLNCNVLSIGKNHMVSSVGKNIKMSQIPCKKNIVSDGYENISMETILLDKEIYINMLNDCIKTGHWDSIYDCIYKNVQDLNVNAYEFKGYLSYIDSIHSYYKANMDILDVNINKELFFNNGLIYTKIMDESPTKYSEDSEVNNSLIANGCLVEGKIKSSVISRRVIVHEGAEIENCIIMQGCEIKANAKLSNVIIDKNNIIDENVELKGDINFPLVIEKKALL
jgi:glucose-1-phosphate adenylyltransferase